MSSSWLQQQLVVAFHRHVGAVGAAVDQHEVVVAPLDGAVVARGRRRRRPPGRSRPRARWSASRPFAQHEARAAVFEREPARDGLVGAPRAGARSRRGRCATPARTATPLRCGPSAASNTGAASSGGRAASASAVSAANRTWPFAACSTRRAARFTVSPKMSWLLLDHRPVVEADAELQACRPAPETRPPRPASPPPRAPRRRRSGRAP